MKCKSSEKLNSLSIAYFPIPTALFSRAIFVADEAVFSRDAKSKYKILQTKNLKEQFFMTKKIFFKLPRTILYEKLETRIRHTRKKALHFADHKLFLTIILQGLGVAQAAVNERWP